MKNIFFTLFILSLFASLPENAIAKDKQNNSVIVYGEAETFVKADEWELSINIAIKNKTREETSQNYNICKKRVYDVLTSLGVKEKEIMTQNFTFAPWYEWEHNSNVMKGYSADHSIKIKSSDLELITKAVSQLPMISGTTINSISHGLQFETRQNELKKLYFSAFKSAKSKIDAILLASEKQFKAYRTISEESARDERTFDAMPGAMNLIGTESSRKSALNISLVPMDIKLTTHLKIIAEFE